MLVVDGRDASGSDRFERVLLGERERDAVLQAYREDSALVGRVRRADELGGEN